MLGHHVTLRLVEDRVLTPGRPARLAVTRWILRSGERFGLVGFAIVDTHLHAVLLGSRARSGRFAQALATCTHRAAQPDLPFAPAHHKPIRTVWHLQNCFQYVLEQHEHHGLEHDPLREATLLPDLLGLRTAAPWSPRRLRDQLPRLRADELRAALPFDRAATPTLDHLPEAAAAAIGHPDLVSRTPAVVDARRAAVQLGRQLFPTRQVRDILCLPTRSATRLATTPAPPALLRAVRLQLALRATVASRPENH